MVANVTSHDLLLIVAIVVFFVAAALHAWVKSITGTLLAVGLAVFAWSFVVTT